MILEIKFEVRDQDEPRLYTWQEAMDHAKAIGDGWRLPTKPELSIMFGNRESIGGFAPKWYWSSSEYSTYDAWYQFFGSGAQDFYDKYYEARVRMVRDIQEATE